MSLLHNAIQSIEAVQALLILCNWPVPKVNQGADPAWNYSGLAINAAMQMGLHHPLSTPDSLHDYSGWTKAALSRVSLRTRVLTWLSCFNINVQ